MEDELIIVDYGLGNLKSIQNMVKKIGYKSLITSDINKIDKAEKLFLPGVGSFDNAMQNINSKNLTEILNKKVLHDKIPILGICLGMQIMCKSSEEGEFNGLGWIDGEVVKFQFESSKYKIPHMGWNVVTPVNENSLFKNISNEELKFYHVHSYYVKLNDSNDQLATTKYESVFTSSFHHENIYGVQFHPEKSHKYGFQLLKNFLLL